MKSALILLALWALPAQAAVFKCVTDKGTVYQDMACPQAAKQSLVETRGTVVQLRTQFYVPPSEPYFYGPQVVILPNTTMTSPDSTYSGWYAREPWRHHQSHYHHLYDYSHYSGYNHHNHYNHHDHDWARGRWGR